MEDEMVDIIHRIGIKAPLSRVYDALATIEGVAGWWTDETTGDARQGGKFKVVFRDHGDEKGKMAFDIVTLKPNAEVRWRCTAGPAEWMGTDVTFKLTQEGEYTLILFGHRNWREAVDFTAHCSTKWATFLLSLRDLVETGKGKPAPHDLKIDNWN
jgi:uncharacterized protein YndB with AHSA1/START domain